MKIFACACLAGILVGAGCSGPGSGSGAPAGRRSEAQVPPLSADQVTAAPGPAEALSLPDRITLPAAYRLMLLDGRLTLVRLSDEQSLAPAPATLRIVTGEIARGEIAYQPGLLPQELAAEVAANRESAGRLDNSLEAVMRRSRELSDQALELKAQSIRLAQLLRAADARIAELEGASGKPQSPAKDPSPGADRVPHD